MRHKFNPEQTLAWCLAEWKTHVKPEFDELQAMLGNPDVKIPREKLSIFRGATQAWNPLFKFVRMDRAENITTFLRQANGRNKSKIQSEVLTPYFTAWRDLLIAFRSLNADQHTISALEESIGTLHRHLLYGDAGQSYAMAFDSLKRHFVQLPQRGMQKLGPLQIADADLQKIEAAAHKGAVKAVKSAKAIVKEAANQGAINALSTDGDIKNAIAAGKKPKKPTNGLVGHPPPPKKKRMIANAAAKAGHKGDTYLNGVTAFYYNEELWVKKGWMDKLGGTRTYFGWNKGETNDEKAIKRLYAAAKREEAREAKEA